MPKRDLAGDAAQRTRLWRAMRMSRQGFMTRDLMTLTQAPRKACEKYIAGLLAAGYLRADGTRRKRVYVLARDTGPAAPRVNSGGLVMDPNEEISRERKRHAELIAEIRRVESRLFRLGAYVEKYQGEAR